MHFSDWSAFWDMGGYGLFVWLSFGAFFAILLFCVALLQLQHRGLQRSIAKELERKKRIADRHSGDGL